MITEEEVYDPLSQAQKHVMLRNGKFESQINNFKQATCCCGHSIFDRLYWLLYRKEQLIFATALKRKESSLHMFRKRNFHIYKENKKQMLLLKKPRTTKINLYEDMGSSNQSVWGKPKCRTPSGLLEATSITYIVSSRCPYYITIYAGLSMK